MPCDSVITNTVDVPQMDPKLLDLGLGMMGAGQVTHGKGWTSFTYKGDRYTLRNGVLSSQEASQTDVEQTAARMKQAYSHQVVRSTAARQGWTLKQVGPNTYTTLKR